MNKKIQLVIILILIIILLTIIKPKYENFIYINNTNDKLPTLTFHSYPNCPIFRNLYFGLAEYNSGKYIQNENVDGMKFRSLIQSTFYNVDEEVEVDLPLINLLVNKQGIEKDRPNFIFNYNGKTFKYIDDNYLKSNRKESVFGVKENFELEDVMRFMNYCFFESRNKNITINFKTGHKEKFDMVHISKMSLTASHLWALRDNNHTTIQHFYILPERIRYMAEKEGKKYTRAKSTGNESNIIVYFYEDDKPDFNEDYNFSSSPQSMVNLIQN